MNISFRVKGFLLHLLLSIVLAALALLLVFGVWYPAPLHAALGVTAIFLILLGVDVVIGPMLTFLVCKQGKKSLKMDLAIIIALQLGAFFYGIYTVALGRPVWMVFNGDRFDLVQAYQLDSPYIEKAKPEYQSPGWFGPQFVAARQPDDVEARNALTFESVFAGIDIPQRPDLYIPYTDDAATVQKVAQPLALLNEFNPTEKVSQVLAEWPQANAFLPMMCRIKPMTVLIDKETSKVIAVVNLAPWK